MKAKTRIFPLRLRQPHSLALVLLATGGVLLSAYAGYREALQHEAISRLQLSEVVDTHFSAVQDRLSARENLAATVAALFAPPALATARALGPYGQQVIALAPEIATVGWLPEVPPGRATDALEAMARSGVERPRFVGSRGEIVEPQTLDRPLYPVIDVAPERNRRIIGIDAGAFPERLQAIRSARERRSVTRTMPVDLVQAPGESALLLYAPVFDPDGSFRGVMGFGYKTERLLGIALGASDLNRISGIRVYDGQLDTLLFEIHARNGRLSPDAEPVRLTNTREVRRGMLFAGHQLTFAYDVRRNSSQDGFWRGMLVAIAGIALTAGGVSLLAMFGNRADMLQQEVQSRRSAEDRLKVLIHELNHRVRNVMSIAQAVVRFSFTSGSDLSDVQKICEGRLQALANALSLLTEQEWKSVGLKTLITPEILPFAERIDASGPEIDLKARAAQTFALLLHELAANAVKHGALSNPVGRVRLRWSIERSQDEPVFRLTWQESGGPGVEQPAHRGFGELLIRRIAPRDIRGQSVIRYDRSGLYYEIEAPLNEVGEEIGSPTRSRVSS